MTIDDTSSSDVDVLIDLYHRVRVDLLELVDSDDMSVAVEARRVVAIIEATLRQYGIVPTTPAR